MPAAARVLRHRRRHLWDARGVGGRRHDELTPSLGWLLVAWSLVSLAIASHRGQYEPATLALAGGGALIATVTALRRAPGAVSLPRGAGVATALTAGAAIGFGATNLSRGPGVWISQLALVAGAGCLVAALPRDWFAAMLPSRWRPPRTGPAEPAARQPAGPRWAAAGLGLGVLAGVARIAATPHPNIDVHRFMQASAAGLLHGSNMYRQCAPGPTGVQCGYPYLPWGSVLLAPFRLLTGDVRYGLVAALAVAVLAAWDAAGGLRRAHPAALALGLLLILFPQAPYSVMQDWTEPLLVASLALTLLLVRRGHPTGAVIAYAIGLATKQHLVLFLPLLALWPRFGWRRAVASAGLGFVLVLPWLIADPSRFWYETVTFNLSYRTLPDALDLLTPLRQTGLHPGFALTAAALLGAYAVAALRLPRSDTGFFLGAALVDWSLDLTNKQSFFNHYTLGMACVVLAVVSALGPAPGPGCAQGIAGEATSVEGGGGKESRFIDS